MALEANPKSGDLYVDEWGHVWKVTGYQPNPTVHIERVDAPDRDITDRHDPYRQVHAIGCLNATSFHRLVRKDQGDG